MFNYAALIPTILGLGGSALMGDPIEKALKEATNVRKIAKPGVSAVNTAYSQAVNRDISDAASRGLSGTSLSGVNNANLFMKRGKLVGDVYDAAQQQAQQAMLGILGMKSNRTNAAQQALGSLTGAGISGLLRGFQNNPEQVQVPDIGSGENVQSFMPKPPSFTDYMKDYWNKD